MPDRSHLPAAFTDILMVLLLLPWFLLSELIDDSTNHEDVVFPAFSEWLLVMVVGFHINVDLPAKLMIPLQNELPAKLDLRPLN